MRAPKRAFCAALSAAAIAVVAMALLAVPSSAQVLYGSLTGNVTDASGAAVPGVKVEVLNVATGSVKQGTSDDRGTYLFSDLQHGTYKVTVSAPAFGTRVFDNAVVSQDPVVHLEGGDRE